MNNPFVKNIHIPSFLKVLVDVIHSVKTIFTVLTVLSEAARDDVPWFVAKSWHGMKSLPGKWVKFENVVKENFQSDQNLWKVTEVY